MTPEAKVKSKSTANVHLRLPLKVHEAISRAAEKNRRPITSEILVRVEATLAQDKS